MNRIEYIFWLANQATSGIFYGWQGSIILLLFFVSAAIWTLFRKGNIFNKQNIQLAYPFLLSILILIIGTLFERNERFFCLPHIIFVGQVGYCFYIVYKTKGIRLLSVSICSWSLWFSFWCSFVSVMSITGDWM